MESIERFTGPKTEVLQELASILLRGERVLITDRGQVIAELRQPVADGLDGALPVALTMLIREHVSVGLPNTPEAYPIQPLRAPEGTARQLIDELRGER